MMIDDKNINVTSVGMHDTTFLLRVEKDHENKDVSIHKNKKEEISDAISNLERFMDRAIRFEIDNELNAVIVKVVDKESGDVIRQIPPEELVALSKKIKEHNGHLLDVIA